MRMLTLPAAFALAFALYLPLPAARDALHAALARLYALALRLFARGREGAQAERAALAAETVFLGALAALLCALHPLACALVMAPLFCALSRLPGAAAVKRALDGGSHRGDTPGYEALVRETCAALAPPFAEEAVLPLLLCAAGLPVHLGCALGWMAWGLRAADCALARRIIRPLDRLADALLLALLTLWSCVAGRNPLRTQGASVRERLLSALGIDAEGRAPVSGDISVAALICCLSAGLLGALLTLVILPLAR